MTTKLVRFKDLKDRQIADSRQRLKDLIEHHDFPRGKLITPNCRTWTEEEIDAWYKSREVEKQPLKGRAKKLYEQAAQAGGQ
jgi:predicted DNA-binding transcriptional regulator AlpA